MWQQTSSFTFLNSLLCNFPFQKPYFFPPSVFLLLSKLSPLCFFSSTSPLIRNCPPLSCYFYFSVFLSSVLVSFCPPIYIPFFCLFLLLLLFLLHFVFTPLPLRLTFRTFLLFLFPFNSRSLYLLSLLFYLFS